MVWQARCCNVGRNVPFASLRVPVHATAKNLNINETNTKNKWLPDPSQLSDSSSIPLVEVRGQTLAEITPEGAYVGHLLATKSLCNHAREKTVFLPNDASEIHPSTELVYVQERQGRKTEKDQLIVPSSNYLPLCAVKTKPVLTTCSARALLSVSFLGSLSLQPYIVIYVFCDYSIER